MNNTTKSIGGISVVTRDGTCDSDVAHCCIVNDEYNLKSLARAGENFIDLGSYCGHASLLAASLGMNCVAVEPLPDNVEIIRDNIAANSFDALIRVIPKSIGSRPIFWNTLESEFSSAHRFVGNANGTKHDNNSLYQAEAVSLEEILNDLDSVLILKTDCEGAEWDAFTQTPQEALSKIKYIVGEFHQIDARTYADMVALLPAFRDISDRFCYASPLGLRLFALERIEP